MTKLFFWYEKKTGELMARVDDGKSGIHKDSLALHMALGQVCSIVLLIFAAAKYIF